MMKPFFDYLEDKLGHIAVQIGLYVLGAHIVFNFMKEGSSKGIVIREKLFNQTQSVKLFW